MSKKRKKLKVLLNIIFFVFVFAFSISIYSSTASSAPSYYAPGSTLMPSCTPGSAGCTVAILPDQTGYAGKFLKTDGSGGLSWSDPDSGLTIGPCNTNERLTWNGSNFLCAVVAAGTQTSGNKIYAGPADGTYGSPSFRKIVPEDLGSGLASSSSVLMGDQTWMELLNSSNVIKSSLLPEHIGAGPIQITGDDTSFTVDCPSCVSTSSLRVLTSTAGDFTISNSGNLASAGNINLDLSATGVVGATYGGTTSIPVIAVDSKGRITNASNVIIGNLTGANLSASAAIANSQLANSSITINAGNGIAGGGTTALGGSTNISINAPTCAASQRLSWNGTSFECKVGGVFGEIVAANQFLLGPTSGASTNPTFRSVVAADLGSGVASSTTVLLGNQTWLDLFDGSKIKSQYLPISGSLTYKGTWNANTNTPTISSGGLVNGSPSTVGDLYIVSVATTTFSIDGEDPIWNVGDWLISDGNEWTEVETSVQVTSVNGQTGDVSLNTSNISENGALYFTDARARNAISSTGPISFSTSTGVIDCPTCVTSSGNGNLVSGTGTSMTGSLTGRLIGSGNVTIGLSSAVPISVNNDTNITGSLSNNALTLGWNGQLSASRGGTGLDTSGAGNGKLLIGNGSGLSLGNITAGGPITVTNGSGSIALDCPTCVTTSGNGDITIDGTDIVATGNLIGRLIGSGNINLSFATTSVVQGTYGSSNISIPIFTVDHHGRLTSASSYNASSIAQSGDVSGTIGNTSVDKIKGVGLSFSSLTNNDLLKYNGSSWVNVAPTSLGAFTVATGTSGTDLNVSSGPITFGGVLTLNIPSSASTSRGLLTAADWNTFNNKQNALSFTPADVANLSTSTSLGTSNTLFPSQNAVKSYVDSRGLTFATGSSGSDINFSTSTNLLGGTVTLNIPDASQTARGLLTTGTQTIAGDKTLSGSLTVSGTTTTNGNLLVSQNFVTPRGADYLVTGVQNDVNLGSGSYFHYAGNGNATFTGIAGGSDGRLIRILNDSEYTLTIKNVDPNSAIGNRIETPNGEDLVLQPELMAALIYESSSGVWHLASQPATANTVKSFAYISGGNAFASDAILGTTDSYDLNFITGGATRFTLASTSSTLIGNGATTLSSASGSALSVLSGTTGALTLDSGSTGAINLGTNANAKTITIGNTTGATAVNINSGSGGINLGGDVTITGGHTFTTGSGLLIDDSNALRLAANDTVIDMTGTGTLGLNTVTNRAITTGSGMFTVGGDLTVSGNHLYMGTNTSGAILVADGTKFNPAVLSGDASINSSGVLTLNYASAQSADTTHKGFLTSSDWNTFYNKQNALGFTPENIANKSTDGTFASSSDLLYPSQKAVKTYVDNAATGLNWKNPVELINVVADSDTPPVSPVHLDGYFIKTGGNTGAWSSFAAGDLVQYQTDHWVKIKSMVVGDYFAVAMKSSTTPSGGMTGKKNYRAQVTGGTPGAFTYTFTAPSNNDALFVQNTNAYYYNTSFVYSTSLGEWVQLSASISWKMGSGLQTIGSTISLGALTSDWSQTGAFDINTNGNININNNKGLYVSGSSTLAGNVFYTKGSDYSITGSQNDVNFGNGSLFNYTGSGTATFTGFAGGTDGRFIRVVNASNYTITLANQNSGSVASNRMIIETGGNVDILPNSSFELSYDSGVSRWRVVVLPANTAFLNGGASYGSIPNLGTLDSYGLNFITGGATRFSLDASSSTLTGNGATTLSSNNTLSLSSASGSALSVLSGTTGALTLDSGSTGAINLGTSANAKTITIGNTTGATAVNINSGSGGVVLNGNTTISGSNTLTTGTGLTTINSTAINLAGNSTVLDLSGSGVLGLNTVTNRAITTGSGTFTAGGSLTVNGTTTASGNLIASGYIATQKSPDYVTTGTQNNVNLGPSSLVRYAGSADSTFTGISGGTDGRIIHLMNASAYTVTITNQDASSTDENRVITPTGASIVIKPTTTAMMQYDSGASRWRILAVTLSGFSIIQGGNALGTTETIGTTDAYGVNFITAGATRFSLDASLSTLTGNGATTLSSNNTLSLSSASGSALSVLSGTTGTLTLDSGSTGAINLGTNANAKTVTIGNTTGATAVNINSGTGGITLLTGTTGALTLDSGSTGTVNLGAGNNAKTINIGTGNAGNIINIGTNNTVADTIAIGSALDSFSLSSTGLNVTSGGALTGVASIDTIVHSATAITFAGTGTLSSGSGTALNLDSGTTGGLNIGTSANAKTITLGNTTGATTLNINTGTGGSTYTTTNGTLSFNTGSGAINIGTDATAKTITLGNGTGATSLVLNAGTGNIDIGANAFARTINIGTGANVIQNIDIGGTGANVIDIGNTQTGGSVNIGAGMTTGTITIGGTGLQTGAITIGGGTGSQNINLGTGDTGSKNINIGTGAVANTIIIGNQTGATSLDFRAGTAGITTANSAATAPITIQTGTTGILTLDSGTTGDINLGTNANAKAITIGNTTGATSLSLNAGTGGVTARGLGAAASGNVTVCINNGTKKLFQGSSATSCNTSSAQFKHDIVSLGSDLGLDAIRKINPVSYSYNDTNIKAIGFIAEEIAGIDTRPVVYDANGKPYALDYNQIIPIIANGIKELDFNLIDPNAPLTNDAGEKTFIAKFFDRLIAWLADASNGIKDIFVGTTHQQKICVGENGDETCITKAQLDAMLLKAGESSSPSTNSPVQTNTETGNTTQESSGTATTTTTESTDTENITENITSEPAVESVSNPVTVEPSVSSPEAETSVAPINAETSI